MKLQRDVFLEVIFDHLKKDKKIFVLSADFGAISLDAIREKFDDNFIHCGISEQNMFDVATGLALEEKKVFVYAISPFISLRAIEQIKCGPSIMNLPMTIISVGIGLGYADAGPTHYATEDFACIRALVGTNIYTPSDNFLTRNIAEITLRNNKLNYVRLDRHFTKDIDYKSSKTTLSDGFRIIGEFSSNKIAIISHGKIIHNCIKSIQKHPSRGFIIDLFKSKPISEELYKLLKNIKKILVVDEQVPDGNLSAAIFEYFCKFGKTKFITSLSLPERHIFENGGRDLLFKLNGLDEDSILKKFEEIN